MLTVIYVGYVKRRKLVLYAECRYYECHYAECRGAEKELVMRLNL